LQTLRETPRMREHAQVDWRRAPADARWWAMDGTGHAFWYLAPDRLAGTDFWYPTQTLAPTFGYAGDWRDSLTERPDIKKPPEGG